MSKFKKALSLLLAVALTAGITITGTMAYLTSEDSDVNVMTLGNVSIAQHEYERVVGADGEYEKITTTRGEGYKLQEFTQNKPLYPSMNQADARWDSIPVNFDQLETGRGAMDVFTNNLAVDKFVVVENTGKSSAYVRTLIAFELGSVDAEDWSSLIMTSNHFTWDDCENVGVVEVEGNKYVVLEYVYKGYNAGNTHHAGGVLPAGEITYNSLAQVYMTADATNEDVEALDGNANGTYDILVLSQACQIAGFSDPVTALDTGFGDATVERAAEWFGGVLAEHSADTWDGTADFALFGLPRNAEPEDIANAELPEDEYVIRSAEELAAFAKLVDSGHTFEEKTVKLGKDIDLYAVNDEGSIIPFDPIGSYRKETPFKGTFDGQGHTIKNLSQNTWELNNGYSYGDLGLGLFGLVEDATIKDLTMDGANLSGESAICGIVAGCAYGDMTFENISVTNSKGADYQYYSGGIVGWASGDHKYINCDVDASTTIAAQWGDFDNSTGGVIGGAGGSATIYMKDCDIACRIDAYNDVTSSYQWYAYRRCGMLIGNTGKTTKNESGTTIASAPQLTCENVNVTYGDWANYTYCEFAGKNWPYVRVQAGVSNSAYSNPRYGHPTDANGNEVVDDNHVHNEGEDHFIQCTFDQLYGGGQGVYGNPAHEGVTVTYNNK